MLTDEFKNFKGKWQYIFLFSHLKELLKLFNTGTSFTDSSYLA
jgi:hypothetical protein